MKGTSHCSGYDLTSLAICRPCCGSVDLNYSVINHVLVLALLKALHVCRNSSASNNMQENVIFTQELGQHCADVCSESKQLTTLKVWQVYGTRERRLLQYVLSIQGYLHRFANSLPKCSSLKLDIVHIKTMFLLPRSNPTVPLLPAYSSWPSYTFPSSCFYVERNSFGRKR